MFSLLLLAAAALPAHDSFACPAPFVHDGDYVRCAGGPKMRLARIDAPEFANSPRCHPRRGGAICDDRRARLSRDNLRRLVASGTVRCQRVDASPDRSGFQAADRYGRPVVRCWVGRTDLSEAQLAGGFATRWPHR